MAGTSVETVAPEAAQVRVEAIDRFRSRHAPLRFAPVVVVMAARDDAASIGEVLAAMPARACALGVDTLVVDDGSRDDTAALARAAGVKVVRLEHHCGHGVALRVGYELAREHGARYIVTLDADGQWNPAELEGVLQPLADDEADFVIGSRVLGATETDDGFRHAGVHVFGWLVRRLTGVTVTDTSSGYRALRAEITATVPQSQVQYQTSELLIGAIAQGYRIAERPIVMRKRLAGESKKGTNLIYGFRYCRVILTTWWRERATAAPVR